MPKLIDNLKEEYINKAKFILMSNGYKALTLRKVAKECGVALGTLYNYFKSKDELVAHIMLADWMSSVDKVNTMSFECKEETECLETIYRMIREFSNKYQFVFRESSLVNSISNERHSMLVSQTSELVNKVLKNKDEKLQAFISEILISYAVREVDEYKNIEQYLMLLIK